MNWEYFLAVVREGSIDGYELTTDEEKLKQAALKMEYELLKVGGDMV